MPLSWRIKKSPNWYFFSLDRRAHLSARTSKANVKSNEIPISGHSLFTQGPCSVGIVDGGSAINTGVPDLKIELEQKRHTTKATTTKRINEMRELPYAPVWQRNYYEHVIRDEESLNKIREYIIHYLARWEYDLENAAGKPDGVERDSWKVFMQKRK